MPDTRYGGAWEEEPGALYRRLMGIRPTGLTSAQDWLDRQFNPAYAQWQARSALGAYGYPEQPEMTTGLTFGDYLGRGIQGIRQEAPGLFRNALNLGIEQQKQWVEDMGGLDALAQLMRNVLGQAYAAPVAQRMAARLPQLREAFTAEYGPQEEGVGGEQSFLNYLRQKYGLR